MLCHHNIVQLAIPVHHHHHGWESPVATSVNIQMYIIILVVTIYYKLYYQNYYLVEETRCRDWKALQSQGSHSQCQPLATSSFAFGLSLPALPVIVPALLEFSPIAQKSGQNFFLIYKAAKSIKDFQIQSVWNLANGIHTYLLTQKVTILQNLLCLTVHAHALSLCKLNSMDSFQKMLSPTQYANLRLFHSCLRWTFWSSWMFTDTSNSTHQTPTVMIPRACTTYPASITLFQALYQKSHQPSSANTEIFQSSQ